MSPDVPTEFQSFRQVVQGIFHQIKLLTELLLGNKIANRIAIKNANKVTKENAQNLGGLIKNFVCEGIRALVS